MNKIYLKQQIELAIKNKKFLKIDYVGKNLKITRDRLIEPLEIKFDEDKEPRSVVAQCYLRHDLREFSFEGIHAIEIIDPTTI